MAATTPHSSDTSGLTVTARAERRVLCIIDVQLSFRAEANEHTLPGIVELATRWLASSPTAKILCTRFVNVPSSSFVRQLGWGGGMSGDPRNELCPELSRALHEGVGAGRVHIVDKSTFSVFTAEVDGLAHERNWTSWLFCGWSTHACVLKSALDAFDRGQESTVVAHLCGSHNREGAKELHDGALMILTRLLGRAHVLGNEEAVAIKLGWDGNDGECDGKSS